MFWAEIWKNIVFFFFFNFQLTLLRLSYSLLLCGLFYEAICCMYFRVSFCSCVFSPFSIAITSLGEERANLSAFRTFVRFVLVWICRFPLPLGVWEGLRFVIVALLGLFSYLFVYNSTSSYLDGLLNIDNIYFDQMVDRIYPTELQLYRANSSDTDAPFWIWIDVYLTVQFPQNIWKIWRFWFWYNQFLFSGWRCPPAYLIWDIHISIY